MVSQINFSKRALCQGLIILALMTAPVNQSFAATCTPGGGDVVSDLPPELAKLLAETSPEEKRCQAPTPVAQPKPLPKTTQRSTPTFQGPILAVNGRHVPDEVIVTLRGGTPALDVFAQTYNLTVRETKVLSILGGLLVRFGIPDGRPVAKVRALLIHDPLVIEAVPNHIYELNGDDKTLDRYSLKNSGILEAHTLAQGRGVKLAIIDTGVDETHPALKGAIKATFNGLEKIPLNTTKHGTAIALLAGGAQEEFKGAAPQASLFIARAFDKTSNGQFVNSVFAILLSLDWALNQQVDIINMSFSGPQNKLMSKALKNLNTNNVVLVAAAGNGGAKAPYSYPAALEGVFAVTAIDAKERIYNKANQGKYIAVAAPGVDLLIRESNQNLTFKSGTSYGAALFSGICALVLEGRKNRDLKTLQQALRATVKDLGAPGHDKIFGYGLVRARDFVAHSGP